MASSKSLPFLAIAGLILVIAVVWNIFNDDSTVVESTTKTETMMDKGTAKMANNSSKVQNTSEPKAVKQSKPVAVLPNVYAHLEDMPIEEAQAEAEKLGQKHMKFAMRYNTPDKALKALQSFRDMNQTDQASALISYMQLSFPETQIPPELLD